MSFDYRSYVGDPLDSGGEYLAGGTDLLTLVRSGLHAPEVVVDIKTEAGPPTTIERIEDFWRLGARATLAEIEDLPALREQVGALSLAAASAATRQIRNRATIGGNVLQRSRCSYYRDPDIDCWLKGGSECPARTGLHEHLALVASGPCISPHPSDPATALVALDAQLTYALDGATAVEPLAAILTGPTDDDRRLHHLPVGAVVRHLDVPVPAGPSIYLKAMDRAAWQFALVGLAAVRDGAATRLVAGGIAPMPFRLRAVEEALAGRDDDAAIAAAADASAEGLEPGDRNRYKVGLLRGLVVRALEGIR